MKKRLKPAFLIEKDYVIINYKRYGLIENKIFFEGLEYELINNNFISYDNENVLNVLLMPIPENQITDKAVLARLNGQIVWCDMVGDWYTYPAIRNNDFAKKNVTQFSKFSTACGQFVLGNLYATPGYKDTLYQTNSQFS